jgi:hypothetical protein
MRGERQLLRLGEYLVGRASRQLPRKARDERYREWVAELPVILRDPQVRFAPRRAVRMVIYAADTFRGTTIMCARLRRRLLLPLTVLLVASLATSTWNIWDIAQAPGQPLNYLRLAWNLLLVAYPVSVIVRCAWRVSTLIVCVGALLGVAVNFWDAVQDPADRGFYLSAASFLLLGLLVGLAILWALARRRSGARKQV